MRKLFTTATIATLFLASTSHSIAQEENEKSIKNMAFLIGEWSLETIYANGAKANGKRVCGYTLRETFIKCTTESTFTAGPGTGRHRDLETFFNYNRGSKNFQEATMFQLPVGKKVGDAHLDTANGTMHVRGYIYSGDGTSGPRVSEDWVIEENTLSMTMRLNRGVQSAHEWPVFISEKMTRVR